VNRNLTRVSTAARKAASARQDFEKAIREAHPESSVRAIAAAAGLSPARVHQILRGN
jgi:hypothetical protein